MTTLFDAYSLGDNQLKNRAVVAPMTRARAKQHTPDADTARYYRQRAGAGLIVTEGTPISQEGCGFIDCPGIWNAAQVAGWRQVTEAVHELGSTIFTQIWHVGRISHTSLQPGGQAPVSATGRQASQCKAFALDAQGNPGFLAASQPRALETAEVAQRVADFASAARNAVVAGFDGVEIHGANGYLIEQFINGAVNDRQDQYGSQNIENRLRFVLEVVDACIAAIGADKVAIRLSPFGRLHALGDFDGEEETFLELGRQLARRQIAYVHIMDQASRGAPAMPAGFLQKFRCAFTGTLILAGGMTLESANQMLAAGTIDLAGFGVPYIANPDLVERLRHGWPLATAERDSYYGGDRHGYIDYLCYGQPLPASA